MPAKKKKKIEITDLKKAFGPKKVLDGVDVSVNEGESLVIIGGSGTGKSVLIKSVLGIIHPDSGSIKVDGTEATKFNKADREEFMSKIGMLFQGGALFDSIPVWHNIAFRLMNRERIARSKARDIAAEKLAQVGMGSEVMELSPAELSGGMQKRVALARAIAANPEIIFFDEPTTGLDPIMADVIDKLIVKCSKEIGATTVTITHDMQSVRRVANKVAMIHAGKIKWHGDVKKIDKSGNKYVDQFVKGKSEGPIKMAVKK